MTTESQPSLPYLAAAKQAWINALNVNVVLLLISFAAVAIALLSNGVTGIFEISIASVHPALASLLLILMAPVLPSLYSSPIRIFPKNITFPLLFGTLVVMFQALLENSPIGVMSLGDVQRFDRIWANLLFVLAVVGAQMGVLTIGVSLLRRKRAS
jgi:hypothetical protein